jgi:hypothetical protein
VVHSAQVPTEVALQDARVSRVARVAQMVQMVQMEQMVQMVQMVRVPRRVPTRAWRHPHDDHRVWEEPQQAAPGAEGPGPGTLAVVQQVRVTPP